MGFFVLVLVLVLVLERFGTRIELRLAPLNRRGIYEHG